MHNRDHREPAAHKSPITLITKLNESSHQAGSGVQYPPRFVSPRLYTIIDASFDFSPTDPIVVCWIAFTHLENSARLSFRTSRKHSLVVRHPRDLSPYRSSSPTGEVSAWGSQLHEILDMESQPRDAPVSVGPRAPGNRDQVLLSESEGPSLNVRPWYPLRNWMRPSFLGGHCELLRLRSSWPMGLSTPTPRIAGQ